MPQVSDKFGPIRASVVLDGSGNGQVEFQAQGSNIRITNLFVQVSTATSQAVAFIYKGYVADGNQISNTNSGSTGGAAHGAIDLFDGEKCIVRWTGGDVGSTATATFVGIKLDFKDRPTSTELTWDDPIAAGDGSLVYPALKSPNYSVGVSGWIIDRLGNAEFNSVTVRGSVIISGPQGQEIQLIAGTGEIRVKPQDSVNGLTVTYGDIFGTLNDVLANGFAGLALQSPTVNGLTRARIDLVSDSTSGTGRYVQIQGQTRVTDLIVGTDLTVTNDIIANVLTFADYGVDAGKGIVDSVGRNTNTAAISTTESSVLTSSNVTYKAGRAYGVKMSGPAAISTAPNRGVSRLRKANTAGQQLALTGHQFSTTTQGNADWSAQFFVSGSDVTTPLCWTGITGTAGLTITYQGANSPVFMEIYDIGPASRVSGYANQLV